jgi:hypothetical protein
MERVTDDVWLGEDRGGWRWWHRDGATGWNKSMSFARGQGRRYATSDRRAPRIWGVGNRPVRHLDRAETRDDLMMAMSLELVDATAQSAIREIVARAREPSEVEAVRTEDILAGLLVSMADACSSENSDAFRLAMHEATVRLDKRESDGNIRGRSR